MSSERTNDGNFDDELDAAWGLLADGDVQGARRAAVRLAADDPESPDVLLLKAACAREAGEHDEALALLAEASKADPDWATPELWMAELLCLDEERSTEALKHARRALDLAEEEDEFLDAVLLKAHLELELGKTHAAAETLSELPPESAGALPEERIVEVAELLIGVGRADEARDRVRHLLDRRPDDSDAWYVLGLAAEALDDTELRAEAWQRTRELDRSELERIPESERLAEAEVEACAEAALGELPERARALLVNVPIVIAELPAVEDVREGVDPRLLGMFVGQGYADESHMGGHPTLTQILLFRRNLERMAGDDDVLREEIRRTLLHETGHFFGLDEAALARVGLD